MLPNYIDMSDPDAPISALAEQLRPLFLRIGRKLRREAEPLGLSATDTGLIGLILLNEGLGVSELADLEQTSRPTMSVHVKRLEAAGWVARDDPDPADKRRVGLRVTEAGRAARDAVRQRRTDWLARRLAALTPEQRAALDAALAPLTQIAGERY